MNTPAPLDPDRLHEGEVLRLETILLEGPEGFLGDRLKVYAWALSNTHADAGSAASAASAAKAAFQFQDIYAIWQGSSADHRAVQGATPPAEWVALETALGLGLEAGLQDFRIEAWHLCDPPDGKNLFELLMLFDQRCEWGTGLSDAFAGTVLIGSSSNGDSYHLCTVPEHQAPRPHPVLAWRREAATFSHTVADSLSSLIYLEALSWCDDNRRISAATAASGYRQLHGRVAPGVSFSMDRRDPGFVAHRPAPSHAELRHRRAVWIVDFLRLDRVEDIHDLAHCFDALNEALVPDALPHWLDQCRRHAPEALYWMWRTFLFGEPELDAFLAVGRGHAARLVRDAAALIEELLAGRNELGTLFHVRHFIERFQALDLDPRRAAVRAGEAAAHSAWEQRLLEEMDGLDTPSLEAFVWRHLASPAVRSAVFQKVLDATPARIDGQLALLINSGNREANAAACADAVFQAALLGEAQSIAIRPGPRSGSPLSHQAWRILGQLATRGRLDPRALPVLRAVLCIEEFGTPLDKRLASTAELLGLARDGDSVVPLMGVLKLIPFWEDDARIESTYGDLIKALLGALRRIGQALPDPETLLQMAYWIRVASVRADAAFTMGLLMPVQGTPKLVHSLVALLNQGASHETHAQAFVACGLIGRTWPPARRAALAKTLNARDPGRDPSVRLAQAVAGHLLGHGLPDAPERMARALLQSLWTEESTRQCRRWALQMQALVPLAEADWLRPLLADEQLEEEALAGLARLDAVSTNKGSI